MKVIRFHAYGGPEVLQYEDVETPLVNSDEILVRVRSAGLSPFDEKVRQGLYKDFYGPLPHILGWDLSGDVVGVGTNVSSVKEGDAVFGYVDGHRMGEAYAEYAVLKKDEAARKSSHVSYHEAAAVAMNGLTAWQALFDTAHLTEGQRVLIHAAAGGIGHLAVQFAKWKGAYVIGTASAKNRQFVLSLGADECIDYVTTPFESAVQDVDLVLDTIGGDTLRRSFSVVKKKSGVIVTVVDFAASASAIFFLSGRINSSILKSPTEECLIAFYLMKIKALEDLGETEAARLLGDLDETNDSSLQQLLDWVQNSQKEHSFRSKTLFDLLKNSEKKGRSIPLHQYLPLKLALLQRLS